MTALKVRLISKVVVRRGRVVLLAVVLAAVAAGAAFGYQAGRAVQMHRGDRADFPSQTGRWSCFDTGASVSCGSGDAFPFAELSQSRRGVTVVVHTLKDPQAGRLVRTTDRNGNGVYTFTALP